VVRRTLRRALFSTAHNAVRFGQEPIRRQEAGFRCGLSERGKDDV